MGQLTQVGAARAQAPTSLVIVSQDPYTNPRSFHRTQVEPDSFAFGSTMVSAFMVGKFDEPGASNFGWAVSTDDGKTWTDGFLPSTTHSATPLGPWQRLSDPAMAYDAMHEAWLVMGLARTLRPFQWTVFVSRSVDGAKTFGEPVVVKAPNESPFFEKPSVGCDNTPSSPFYGHCYAEWDDEAHGLRLLMKTSTDGGLTWRKAAVTKDTHVIDGQPLVQPDGTVIMPIDQCCPTRIDAFI